VRVAVHEYSIVQALLERVDREARRHHASHVHCVRVSIGEVAGVEVALLRTAFDTIRHGTCCAAANLDVRTVEATWACRGCGKPIVRGTALRCPACGEPARLVRGDEIMLDQIEMEAP
jgi:hydrogenase nickel incorporation protein HypA/HybF